MLSIHYLTIAAYAAGLVATLILAAFLTPSRWWQRPNVRALTIVAGGTWGIGTLLMGLAQAPALAATPLAAPALLAAPASTGRTFRVRDDLNLRTGQGIGAQRIAVVPAGTLVTTTGLRLVASDSPRGRARCQRLVEQPVATACRRKPALSPPGASD